MGSAHKRLWSSNAQLDIVSVAAHREGSSFLVYKPQAQGSPWMDKYYQLIDRAGKQQLADNTVEGGLLSFVHLEWNAISHTLFLRHDVHETGKTYKRSLDCTRCHSTSSHFVW